MTCLVEYVATASNVALKIRERMDNMFHPQQTTNLKNNTLWILREIVPKPREVLTPRRLSDLFTLD